MTREEQEEGMGCLRFFSDYIYHADARAWEEPRALSASFILPLFLVAPSLCHLDTQEKLSLEQRKQLVGFPHGHTH